MRLPVLSPIDGLDARGIEDPHVTEINHRFYMCYTDYGFEFKGDGEPTDVRGGVLPMIAVSDNLITWEQLGPIVRVEDNKDHVLFPRKLKGRYATLHRCLPNVWLAYSDDLLTWDEGDMSPIYGPP